MYFHRIAPRRNGLGFAKALRATKGDAYGHHQFIWQLFPGLDQRRFLFRRDDVDGWPRYYMVSALQPQDDQGVWQIESKAYSPRLVEGQRLVFSLRANPVVTRKDSHGKRHRHDVVMDEKSKMGFREMSPLERPPLSHIVSEAGLKWLADRAPRHGFTFAAGQMAVEGYQQHKVYKRQAKLPIRFSTMDFTGVLQVLNPELFVQALFHGIGPAKGFGCGLLMVRPTS
jgi:CRISPR system Cascade subunit CasE